MSGWLYRRMQKDSPGITTFEVGFFVPLGTGDQMGAYWEATRAFAKEERAARMVNYLNGGSPATRSAEVDP
jgi:hypothetical protein